MCSMCVSREDDAVARGHRSRATHACTALRERALLCPLPTLADTWIYAGSLEHAGLIYFIMLKYAIALSLTSFINEDFVNIAWDSAGVTTGPVTVPFVLSVGVGCSKAVRASEGFGESSVC